MNELNCTPGPREVIGNLIRSPMHQPQGLPRGVQIAECRDGYFLTHTDEAKANARMMGAALVLFETLKLVAGEVTPGVRSTSADSHLPQDIVREVHAAIRLVTGE